MQSRVLPNNTIELSTVGLGGEGVLRTHDREREADAVIREALSQGITYFDCARVYADSERYYGRVWGREPSLRQSIFQTSKSASRDRAGAIADLESSLERLQTDYLDLWQIHDVRTAEELSIIEGPGGALEGFVEAREQGRVRHIGVTGHHDPQVLTRAVQQWPVDAVLLPVNPVEEIIGGFLTHTLPAARDKGIAVIGMKLLGGSYYLQQGLQLTPEVLIRYALSVGITLPVVGCSNRNEVRTLANIGKANQPLPSAEKEELLELLRPYAARLAFYRGLL